jgi:hypothetical protein
VLIGMTGIVCASWLVAQTGAGEVGERLNLPKVDGWKAGSERPIFGEDTGYSVGYSGQGVTVTVYVYNRGLKSVPDDLTAKEVQQEFELVKEAVQEAKSRGIYEDVKELKSDQATLGGLPDGPKALHVVFNLRVLKQDSRSEFYLLTHRNHFIKLRVSRTIDGGKEQDADLARLYKALANELAK